MIIELLDGTRYDIEDYSLKRLYHYIPSATIEHNSVTVDARSDVILNSKVNNRTISVDFVYISRDIFDFYLIREEVNALFLREEAYYITFKNEPHKRWLVKVANGYNLQPNQKLETFTIDFITINAYAESIATTQTLKEWDVDAWSWNGAIDWEEDLQYSFNTNEFTLNNLGNATIDPRVNQLRITVKGNFQNIFQIINRTTNEVYDFSGNLTSSDELVLDGIRSLKNGVSVFSTTNKKLITLKPGLNRFSVLGGTLDNIDFDFRFIYK